MKGCREMRQQMEVDMGVKEVFSLLCCLRWVILRHVFMRWERASRKEKIDSGGKMGSLEEQK